jgi:hypothetical protein
MVITMAKKETINFRHIWRFIAASMIVFVFTGGYILLLFNIILLLSLPWYLLLLISLLSASPLIAIMVYLVFWTLIPFIGGIPVKGFRQWTVAYGIGILFIVYLAFFAFFFETFIPIIPEGYRKVTLPLIAWLITIVILTRTRLRPRFERFLKRLFYGSANRNKGE